MDYEPIDISAWCGAGAELLPGEDPMLGEQTMRGLPFTVGAPGGDPSGKCYVSLAEGDESVAVPVGKAAHTVVFAHRQMETEQHSNGPVGVHVADYVIRFEDSETVTVPIRERYEISVVSDRQGISRFGIGFPYLAVTDREDTLMPRYEGRFDMIGRRQTESVQAQPAWYWLWAWSNPTPDRIIESIEFVPRGPRFIVAGVTLGHVDEHPFSRDARRPVRVSLKDAEKRREALRPRRHHRPRRAHLRPPASRAIVRRLPVRPAEGIRGGAEPEIQPGLRRAVRRSLRDG